MAKNTKWVIIVIIAILVILFITGFKPLTNLFSPPVTNCPDVCKPLYELNNQCALNTCGSGGGADGAITFNTLSECQEKLMCTLPEGCN